jgi:hypothetical protein
MRRLVSIIVLLAGTALAQGLPSYGFGVGASDNRGTAHPYNVDVTFTVRMDKLLPTSDVLPLYWWTDISSPIARGTPGQPVPSVITTGGAYVLQAGRMSLIGILESGISISTVQASGGANVVAAFSGSVAAAYRIGGNWNVMVGVKALATTAPTTVPNGVSTIAQPFFKFVYTLK